MKLLKMEASGVTDEGTTKEINEDGFFYKIVDAGTSYAGVFAVADGVGGGIKGEVASATAIAQINKWWEEDFKRNFNDKTQMIQSLIFAFQHINEQLLRLSENSPYKIATTLSVLVLYQNQYFIVHTGDSRIYKYGGLLTGKLVQLTQDQSCFVNKNSNGRTLKKSVLTECLGYKNSCNHFCASGEIKKNNLFFLCSDGVYKTIPDTRIREMIHTAKANLEAMCRSFIDCAEQNGETDNITAIAVKIVM
jgi:protein phosphatase